MNQLMDLSPQALAWGILIIILGANLFFLIRINHVRYRSKSSNRFQTPDEIRLGSTSLGETNLVIQALKESEAKYRAFFINSMDGLLLTAPTGEILAANPAACLLFQMTEEEICNAGRSKLVDVADPRLAPLIAERQMKGQAKGELTFIRKDNSKFPGEINSAVFKDVYGQERTSMIIRDLTAQKGMENKLTHTSDTLQQTLRGLNNILDTSLDVICSIDKTGRFVNVSAASESLWGYTPQALTGRNFIDLVFEEDVTLTLNAAAEIFSGSPETIFENRFNHKDGPLVDILWSARWDDQDQLAYCIAKDAREKKKLEKAFDFEKQRFHDLFLQAPSAIGILKGPNHIYQTANPLYLQLIDKKDIIGKTVKEVLPEIEEQGFFDLLDGVYQTGKTFTANEMLIQFNLHGNGNLVDTYLNFIYQAYRDVDGNIEGIFFFAINVTEQVLSRKKIEESEKRYRQIVETAQEGIWMIDENDRTTFVNDKLCEIFEYSREELMGKEIYSFMDKEWKQIASNLMQRKKEGEAGQYTFKYISKTGKEIWTNSAANPLFREDGTYQGALAMITDITENKKAEENARQIGADLAEAQRLAKLGSWNFDVKADKLTWSDELYHVFGTDKNTFLETHKSFLHLIDENDRELVEKTTRHIQETGEDFTLEYNIITPQGENRIIQEHGYGQRDYQGKVIRLFGTAQDITQRKNEELQKSLLREISLLFHEPEVLNITLQKVLERLVAFGGLSMAESWLVSADRKRINQVAKFYAVQEPLTVYDENTDVKSYARGECLPGIAWETKIIQSWQNIDKEKNLLCTETAKKAGLQAAFALPILYNNEVIGVFVLVPQQDKHLSGKLSDLFKQLMVPIGAEIKRKQVEQELDQIFTFAPDIICIVNMDGYFKKINPAACELLEYTESELLAFPVFHFVHPDDIDKTTDLKISLGGQQGTINFENRYITKSGKTKWLAWTYSPSPNEGLIYAVAKDITDKKELEVLLNNTNSLARIGSWELDLVKETLYWSNITREIHEIPKDYVIGMDTLFAFFKEGKCRALLMEKVNQACKNGNSWDVEALIITACGKTKWIRAIGEAAYVNGKCVRLYGSIQDIDVHKRTELSIIEVLEEKNTILESIGDAFFAVDLNWTVTYWNNQAEKMLGITKTEILGSPLWRGFSDKINLQSTAKFYQAMESKMALHFEDYCAKLNKWHEVSIYPLDEGLSVYLKDITDRVQYIQAIEIQNKKLQDIAWTQSHIVRAPLAKMMGIVEILKDLKMSSTEFHEWVNHFVACGTEFDEIIRDIVKKTEQFHITRAE